MRLTVDEAIDLGLLGKVKVKLNGEYVRDVVVADEEEGYIKRFKKVDGKFVINRKREDVETEILYGNVVIEISNEATQTAKQTTGDDTEGTETT
ncbi:hypothetical protein [Acinetobacter pseudolwoffii]|uniref:hypothetical protein n=1 Tax=Acinetobacter pseudolwoffii TaxID=2053287 RepID=UPI0025763470|nr:hypothetical protein [Acinetobacter pseudolwoffii]MDM1324880.1 hypothetical protein [Acinetobacter pseudolwoffii]